jgi:DNA-binding MarR family transcriptional regulator
MDALPADIPYTRLMPPAILLFGDDPGRRLRIAGAVSRCGGRVVASAPIADAAARIGMQAAAGGVILDIRHDGGQALDALVERVDALGEASGRLFALLIVPPALIDVVDARLPGLGARLLVDPSERELAASVTELVAPPLALVEEGGAAGRRRLAELSEEVGRIARALASLSADEAERVPAPVPRMVGAADGPLIRAFIRLRRLRAQHFLPELFADPAWDILLDLAAARIEGRMVAVSSLCIAAAVPATTALRWITQMTEQALLVRRPDPTDGRRVFIGLSDHAAAGMDAYLSAARGVVMPA